MRNFKLFGKRIVTIVVTLSLLISGALYYIRLTGVASAGMGVYYWNVKRNTVDVVCIGSSHVYQGIDTVYMWDNNNIAAHNIATGAQPIWFSYVFLKQALAMQKPSLVIIDLYTISDLRDEIYDTEKVELSMVPALPSLSKLEVLLTTRISKPMDVFLTFPIMHTNYDKLGKHSFETDMEHSGSTLGYNYTSKIIDRQKVESVYDAKECTYSTPCSPKAEKYLRKCIELCQKKDVDILLTNTPTLDITEEKQSIYNYVQTIADEYGVNFVNGCLLYEEMGIDYITDAEDLNHLNHTGCEKYTRWLTSYILDNYDIPIRSKTDKKYELWNYSSKYLKSQIETDKLVNSDLRIDELLVDISKPGWIYAYFDGNKLVYSDDGKIVYSFDLCETFDQVIYIDDDTIELKYDGRSVFANKNRTSELFYIDTLDEERKKSAIFIYNKQMYSNVMNAYIDREGKLVNE